MSKCHDAGVLRMNTNIFRLCSVAIASGNDAPESLIANR